MSGKFRMTTEAHKDDVSGVIRWVCHPASTGARQLTVIDATLAPGGGHAFHKHPHQEEVLYVLAGKVEQWIEREVRVLGFGDAVFLPPGIVHASFNAGDDDVRMIAILGPSVGDGFEIVDVSSEPPWSGLRG
jgi:quercetin dioxygenase-like cupin family protein